MTRKFKKVPKTGGVPKKYVKGAKNPKAREKEALICKRISSDPPAVDPALAASFLQTTLFVSFN